MKHYGRNKSLSAPLTLFFDYISAKPRRRRMLISRVHI
jgi:hypothetical protein